MDDLNSLNLPRSKLFEDKIDVVPRSETLEDKFKFKLPFQVSKELILASIVVIILIIISTIALFPKSENYYEKVQITPAGKQVEFTIITNYNALLEKYGANTANQIILKANELANTVENEGLKSTVILLDDATHATSYKFAPINSDYSSSASRDSLEIAIENSNASHVLIIGNLD